MEILEFHAFLEPDAPKQLVSNEEYEDDVYHEEKDHVDDVVDLALVQHVLVGDLIMKHLFHIKCLLGLWLLWWSERRWGGCPSRGGFCLCKGSLCSLELCRITGWCRSKRSVGGCCCRRASWTEWCLGSLKGNNLS